MVPFLVVCLVLSAAVASSSANQPEPETAEETAAEPDPAIVDPVVEAYSLEFSVSYVEAQRRLDRIGGIKEALETIRGLESDRLAGWGIDHEVRFGGWVWLVGDESVGAAALEVADVHADVDIRTGAKYTYNELQTAQKSFARELFDVQASDTSGGAVANSGASNSGTETPGTSTTPDLDAGLAQAVTFLNTDMERNSMLVAIDPASLSVVGPLGSTSELSFEQSAALVNNLLKPHIDVSYTITDGSGFNPTSSALNVAEFRGGRGLFPTAASTSASCTSGFTVQTARRPPSEPYHVGVLTAGHCGQRRPNDSQAFYVNTDSNIPGNRERLPFVFGYFGANADAQWHRINLPNSGSYNVTNEFRCRDGLGYPNPYCKVTRTETRTNMIGDFVCHAGINSGVSCGRVVSIDGHFTRSFTREEQFRKINPANACLGSAGQPVDCAHVFVVVQGKRLGICGGDSGGPVFRGGTAYGIVQSGTDTHECFSTDPLKEKTMIFSAISEVESFLSVSVLTNPVTLTSS